MTTPVRSARRPPLDAVSAAARLLAVGGPDALDDVMNLLLHRLPCAAVTLRGSAPVRVLAHRSVRASAPAAEWVIDVPMRAAGVLYGVLTAVATRPLRPDQAEVLTGAADVLALALSAQRGADAAAAGRVVLDAEADRAQIAADLLEGVGHALVSVRYAAELVARGRAAESSLDEPVRAALLAVRQAHRDLRAHALEAGLRVALRELADRCGADRPDDGRRPLRVTVEAEDPRLDDVPPPVAVTVQRVAETVLRGASGQARVCAVVDGPTVKLRVESADKAYDASELVRWARRVSALGGVLTDQVGGVEVSLPAQPSAEGHHDDSPDL